MTANLQVRQSGPGDWPAIESLYPQAFPDEDLLPLVRELRNESASAMSLVGEIDSTIVGHGIFTRCGIIGLEASVALLGPLAVAPAWQRRGIGKALVAEGVRRLGATGVSRVFVLGDPVYYGRLGFLPERLVEPPFPLPAEWAGAWQSQTLARTPSPLAGRLAVTRPRQRRDLWSP